MSKRIKSGNIIQVNHFQLKKIIKRAYYVKEPLFVQGAIGIGKSYVAREAGRELSQELSLEFIETKIPLRYPDRFCFVDIRIAQKDAGEIIGLPDNYALVKDESGNIHLVPVKAAEVLAKLLLSNSSKSRIIDYITKWNRPPWMPIEGHGMIFLDEFNLAPPLVQNVMYELINDRAFGDYILPDGWLVVGAGNRGYIDGAPTFDFGDPLNDRFSWYELQIPTVEDWTEWAFKHGIDHRIIGFLQTKRSALYTHKPDLKEKAFATPRSWEHVSNLIKGVDDIDEIYLYASGRVGTYVAGEFKSFLEASKRLPPIDLYFTKPDKAPIPDDLDLLFTLCTNLADYYIHHKEYESLRCIVRFALRLTAEFTQFLLKMVKSIDQRFFVENTMRMPEITKLKEKLGPYLID